MALPVTNTMIDFEISFPLMREKRVESSIPIQLLPSRTTCGFHLPNWRPILSLQLMGITTFFFFLTDGSI